MGEGHGAHRRTSGSVPVLVRHAARPVLFPSFSIYIDIMAKSTMGRVDTRRGTPRRGTQALHVRTSTLCASHLRRRVSSRARYHYRGFSGRQRCPAKRFTLPWACGTSAACVARTRSRSSAVLPQTSACHQMRPTTRSRTSKQRAWLAWHATAAVRRPSPSSRQPCPTIVRRRSRTADSPPSTKFFARSFQRFARSTSLRRP